MSETMNVSFKVSNGDRVGIAIQLLLALTLEEDWKEGETPTTADLAGQLTKVWITCELRQQLRLYGATFADRVYDRLDRHREHKRAILFHAEKRIAELFPLPETSFP